MKGSNWIPVDCFLDRATPARYRELLEAAVSANMNSIRVWGGGVYEADVFYTLADELGLLIWQDLMFACAMYPVHAKFLHSVRLETAYQINRLSKHPSIMAWTANNENEGCLVDNWYQSADEALPRLREDYVKLYIDTVMAEVVKHDVTRPFLPSSPTNGKVTRAAGWISHDPTPAEPQFGDVHFYNYDDDGFDYKIYPRARYASEYGFQSWPSYDTLLPVVDEETDLWYGSPFYDYRQHNHKAGEGTEQIMRRHFTWPDSGNPIKDFKDFIYLTQVTQAMCYKIQTEFYRRGRGDPRMHTMGALYWQHNDIWQAPTWSTIDYAGRWKMAHYYAALFFRDTIVSAYLNNDDDSVHVHSVRDQADEVKDATLTVSLWKWSEPHVMKTWSHVVNIPGRTSYELVSSPLRDLLKESGCEDRRHCFMTFTLEGLSDATPLFLVPFREVIGLKDPAIKVSQIRLECAGVFTIILEALHIAAFLWMETGQVKGHFSNNGFLMTSRQMEVKFFTDVQVTVTELQWALHVRSLYDVYD